jgi:putative ABC transport system permease protein
MEVLIVGQLATTLVLLASAGLLAKSFVRTQQVDLGFANQNAFMADLSLPVEHYPDDQLKSRRILVDAVLEKVRALPRVSDATVAYAPPLDSRWQIQFDVVGRPTFPSGEEPYVEMNIVGASYFETLGIPLLHGRHFSSADHADAPGVVIIDEAFAERHWPNEDALGQVVTINDIQRQVIGIVPTLRVYGFDADSTLIQAYLHYPQDPTTTFRLIVNTTSEPESVRASLDGILASVDPNQPIASYYTMQDRIDETFVTPRLYTSLFSSFSIAALLLASIGLFGVIFYSVSQRTREIGIRIALGSQRNVVFATVLKAGARLIFIALVVGVGASFLTGKSLSSQLYDVSGFSPDIIGGVCVVLVLVALAASWISARCAARTDPMEALRYE